MMWIKIVQIILAVLLMLVILLQQRGTALGGAFAGGGEFYRSRRGIEKVLFIATIVLAGLFVIMAILNLVL